MRLVFLLSELLSTSHEIPWSLRVLPQALSEAPLTVTAASVPACGHFPRVPPLPEGLRSWHPALVLYSLPILPRRKWSEDREGHLSQPWLETPGPQLSTGSTNNEAGIWEPPGTTGMGTKMPGLQGHSTIQVKAC